MMATVTDTDIIGVLFVLAVAAIVALLAVWRMP